MLVILNPSAGGGLAPVRWASIELRFRRIVQEYSLKRVADVSAVPATVAEALHRGEREFVAAGGDGTVNAVASALLDLVPLPRLSQVKLGAVGLGSSNDFHKSATRHPTAGQIPCRLDFAAAFAHDVGILTGEGAGGRFHGVWLINASLGTTAEANLCFNRSTRLMRLLKRLSPWHGMVFAATRTILTHRPHRMRITADGALLADEVARNVAIVKSPHFAGRLHYDSPYDPASGSFHVHVIRRVGLSRLIRLLVGLARGAFTGRPGTLSCCARRVSVESAHPFAIERDGEVCIARRAVFTILPVRLQVCP